MTLLQDDPAAPGPLLAKPPAAAPAPVLRKPAPKPVASPKQPARTEPAPPVAVERAPSAPSVAPVLPVESPEATTTPAAGITVAATEPTAGDTAPTARALSVFGSDDVDQRARPLARPAPRYPVRARRLGKEADRQVLVTVSAEGHVLDAEVAGGAGDEFDQEALAGVRGWRFSPARRDGVAVASRVSVIVHFRLDR